MPLKSYNKPYKKTHYYNQQNKNEWSITRDASKFHKLFGRLPQSSKKDGEIYKAENDTNEHSDQDEHEEDEEYNEGDIEQDNEGANDGNVEPPMARRNAKDSHQLGSETMKHKGLKSWTVVKQI
ncbi:Hypothetical predicted protein [Paramuricea clavata]|uniref:Uncharacterized protein n=1 Tax=Paramuricea clavata TaxID=317549 RepID=A0A6S7FX61_PARCT|nr:Hypothetical predicted protein [Paramuricea clavata]